MKRLVTTSTIQICLLFIFADLVLGTTTPDDSLASGAVRRDGSACNILLRWPVLCLAQKFDGKSSAPAETSPCSVQILYQVLGLQPNTFSAGLTISNNQQVGNS